MQVYPIFEFLDTIIRSNDNVSNFGKQHCVLVRFNIPLLIWNNFVSIYRYMICSDVMRYSVIQEGGVNDVNFARTKLPVSIVLTILVKSMTPTPK